VEIALGILRVIALRSVGLTADEGLMNDLSEYGAVINEQSM